jgi:putative hydrolase of the HAD superfamily
MLDNLNPQAVLFDLYGTLLDIQTDEHQPELWQTLARYLRYQGLPADAERLQKSFAEMVDRGQQDSSEKYPETDVRGVFGKIVQELGCLQPEPFSTDVSMLFRALSIIRMDLFDDTLPSLRSLRGRFQLGLVSDAQRVFLVPEIEMTGLAPLLDVVVISTDHGFHKPDPRLFDSALSLLGVEAQHAVFVGDSVRRDMCGAENANIPAVLLAREGPREGDDAPQRRYQTISSLSELCDWLLPQSTRQ